MEEHDNEDAFLQRTSGGSLSTVDDALRRMLFRHSPRQPSRLIRKSIRKKDLDRIIALIEPFQEEPQLLDAKLKDLVSPLTDAFTLQISQDKGWETRHRKGEAGKEERVPALEAICKILYVLCKVRGEKIISRFFNNEVRWLEPLLATLEARQTRHGTESPKNQEHTSRPVTWEEIYIMLLWLSHLVLAPFDLASISSRTPSDTPIHDVKFPPTTPGIARRVVTICLAFMTSATIAKRSAALLLARLALRPGMRKMGLLDELVRWTLVPITDNGISTIHHSIAILTFLSRLTASARSEEIYDHVEPIYRAIYRLANNVEPDQYRNATTSAVVKKLEIKILQNCIAVYLSSSHEDPLRASMEAAGALEEVIDFLLTNLADRDTPVRYAASKALSVITLKLEPDLADEITTAILESLQEDVGKTETKKLTAVNPLRWHGLTLTLAQLLFRRSPSPTKLPEILTALILSLKFEQRSATGGFVGTNIRDAACFGIWSIARRYTTKELNQVDSTMIENCTTLTNRASVIQILATELLVAACLDPAGNVRRGSSAALQELVGRHPDIIFEGISLVQIVDYHAVGLRQRAIVDVAFKASNLHKSYWNALFRNILEWRGIGSPDAASRETAAAAIGKLKQHRPAGVLKDMVELITMQLGRDSNQLEDRHGLILALASIINTRLPDASTTAQAHDKAKDGVTGLEEIRHLVALWQLLTAPSESLLKDLKSRSRGSHLTAAAVLSLMEALAKCSAMLEFHVDAAACITLDHCLNLGSDESVLQHIPSAVAIFASLLQQGELRSLVDRWSERVKNISPQSISQSLGYFFALSGAFCTLDTKGFHQQTIVDSLTSALNCTTEAEARSKLLRAMRIGLLSPSVFQSMSGENQRVVLASIENGLNDYSITERGDVGSLVRIEALESMKHIRENDLASTEEVRGAYGAVLRLAAEKLDKVRLEAARALIAGKGVELNITSVDLRSVSTPEYFRALLDFVHATEDHRLISATLEGYVSSSGSGSETLIQASRDALIHWLFSLPDDQSVDSLLHICEILLDILRSNLINEHVVFALLEVIGFLFDMQIHHRLMGSSFKWRTLLSLVQKSHHKSNNISKILAAVNVYRGLAEVDVVRSEVIRKLASMLKHPFPKVRTAVAEALFLITMDEELQPVDWGGPVKELESSVSAFGLRHVTV